MKNRKSADMVSETKASSYYEDIPSRIKQMCYEFSEALLYGIIGIKFGFTKED